MLYKIPDKPDMFLEGGKTHVSISLVLNTVSQLSGIGKNHWMENQSSCFTLKPKM